MLPALLRPIFKECERASIDVRIPGRPYGAPYKGRAMKKLVRHSADTDCPMCCDCHRDLVVCKHDDNPLCGECEDWS